MAYEWYNWLTRCFMRARGTIRRWCEDRPWFRPGSTSNGCEMAPSRPWASAWYTLWEAVWLRLWRIPSYPGGVQSSLFRSSVKSAARAYNINSTMPFIIVGWWKILPWAKKEPIQSKGTWPTRPLFGEQSWRCDCCPWWRCDAASLCLVLFLCCPGDAL